MDESQKLNNGSVEEGADAGRSTAERSEAERKEWSGRIRWDELDWSTNGWY